MKTDRHGLPILATGDLFGAELPELQIRHSIPADVVRRFRTVKRWHYPSATLYRLQDGKCFYCGKALEDAEYGYQRPRGYRKCHFMPRGEGFTLFGNKVLSCASCAIRHAEEYPTVQQKENFCTLYSPARFEAVAKEGML